MQRHTVAAALLVVASASQLSAVEDGCDPSSPLKSVVAVYSNRHDTAAVQFVTWDIYLMDPADRDDDGFMRVWKRLPGLGGDWAPAVSPDGKGRIVFDSNRNRAADAPLNASELFLMKARGDDSDQTLLTRGSSASWSPDGKRIVFHASASGAGIPINGNPGAPTSDSVIFVGKVGDLLEGAAPQQVTDPPQEKVDDDSDWSPAGERIAFVRKDRVNADQNNPTSAEIYAVESDGTGLVRLTDNGIEERSPAWSPDGSRLVFSCRRGTKGGNTLELCIMNADGSGLVVVTDNAIAELSPRFTPDGTKIVFQRAVANPVPGQGQQTWIMDAEGTVQAGEQLTAPPGIHNFPSWAEIKCAGKDAGE
jgi:TolB protein